MSRCSSASCPTPTCRKADWPVEPLRQRFREARGLVVPGVARLRGRAREHPETNAIRIDLEEIGEARDGVGRRRAHARLAVEQVLRRVIRPIADERLRVDREPGLALGPQHIPRVQIGHQEHIVDRGIREVLEQAKSFADQARITPFRLRRERLRGPVREHFGERTKRVW